jgi:SNF2 family DNA or RNA helicase
MTVFVWKEPSWNPGVEAQVVDCLYRLGQEHEVHVYRYFINGSLEMNIHQIQRRKAEMALYVNFYTSVDMWIHK